MNIRNRFVAVFISLLIIGVIFYYFSDIVAYVLVAWVLSMIGQPLMFFFQRRIKFGRFTIGSSVSAILTIICFFIVFGLILGMFVPLIIEQARNLANVDTTAISQALEVPLEQINHYLVDIGMLEPGETATLTFQESLKNWFEPTKIGTFFSSFLGIATNLLFAVFSIVFIAFFFLKEHALFGNFLVAIVPPQHEEHIANALEDITKLLTRYFAGILLQVTVITIFVSIALGVLGIKNALLIGFFAAIINVIPYLGPLIGAIFGVFITISSNLDLEFYTQMMPLLLKVVAVFGAMQLLDNFILQPYIFSNSVLAHPLEIFIIILIGAKLNGIVGMILAIPVYTIIRVIARVFLSEYKIVQKLTGGIGKGIT